MNLEGNIILGSRDRTSTLTKRSSSLIFSDGLTSSAFALTNSAPRTLENINESRMHQPTMPSSSPSQDARNVSDDRIDLGNKPMDSGKVSGVVVVEPSFDADDATEAPITSDKKGIEWQSRSPRSEDTASGNEEKRVSPAPGLPSKHTRDLSQQFHDSARITTKGDDELIQNSAAGVKHRRGLSTEIVNPAQAHRRINSVGDSKAVNRRTHAEGRHNRMDSAGLDVLTAAVDASQEELAVAAGAGAGSSYLARNAWHTQHTARRSPPHHYEYGDRGHYYHSSYPPHGPSHAYHGPPPPSGPHYGGYYSSHHHAPPPAMAPYSHHAHPPPHVPSGPPSRMDFSAYYPPRHPSDPLPPPPSSAYAVADAHRRRPYPEGYGEPLRDGAGVPHHSWRGAPPPPPTSKVPDAGAKVSETAEVRDGVAPSEPPKKQQTHHRKMSSLGSLGPLTAIFPEASGPSKADSAPTQAHHRSTSSVSFLHGIDVDLGPQDATFLRNLQASTGAPAAAALPPPAYEPPVAPPVQQEQKLATGGTSKRVRRKCVIDGCQNRVVQGGLCISHGAKRKQCKYPGCVKHVKKAGLCSTHGPARKRCEAEGCGKVAVQGGRCIAHGAKKKLCSVENCPKQAIMAGMCKKHHDAKEIEEYLAPRETVSTCQPVRTRKTKGSRKTWPEEVTAFNDKPGHNRGLSIFQEISADGLGTLLNADAAAGDRKPSGHRHRSTISRDLASMF